VIGFGLKQKGKLSKHEICIQGRSQGPLSLFAKLRLSYDGLLISHEIWHADRIWPKTKGKIVKILNLYSGEEPGAPDA